MPNRTDLEAALDAAVNLGKAQAKALAALPGAINAVAEAANNINATANEARAVIRKAQAVTDRLDSMLDHVEPAVSEITPTLQALKEAQQRIVAMTGSTEKMASFVEDAGAGLSRLAGISGAAGLFNRIAAAGKPEPGAPQLSAVRNDPAAEILPPETPTEEVLAELVGAESEPVRLDDPEIHDADLVTVPDEDEPDEDAGPPRAAVDEQVVPEADEPIEDPELDEALHPVELGSESDGPDVTESATG
ncbi:MAG: hypothetical protein QOF39_3386 [Frankiales bacterium]|jgi:hypothetical protein|nr:hypothetical protein [Frankiales bacterium]